jgi:hypothetical protein
MPVKNTVSAILPVLTLISAVAQADPIIFEGFTGYPENALISASPAGPAVGLTGDWFLAPENFFYVNRTEADLEAGTGKAVYDMPWDDHGARTAQRDASPQHALFELDGDVFYASFYINPPRADGDMIFTLTLDQLDGGGQPEVSFGMKGGNFIVGNGGVNADILGGVPSTEQMQIILRIEYGDGGTGPDDFEVATLWVNPVNENSIPVIDEVPVDFLNRGGGRITGVAIRGAQMAGQPAFFDDLMVGFDFPDVAQAPPPGTLSNHLGMNGAFYDPNNPGHGFNFVMHELGLAVYYFGHTVSGERLWLVSENFEHDLDFNTLIELEMFEVISGTFGHPQLPETTWGTIIIELADCHTGHASFDGLDDDHHARHQLPIITTAPAVHLHTRGRQY